jgi:hypothetical protein
MCRPNGSFYPKCILMAALVWASVVGAQVSAESKKDPHRPACLDAHCREVESFLKAHYCGQSPYGDGPDNGCQIKIPRGPRPGVDVLADADCEWSEAKQTTECAQHGEPSSRVRSILIGELRRLGLPAKVSGQTFFTVWKSTVSGWSLAAASYSRTAGTSLEVCQVIVIIDQGSHVLVLRKLPFQRTDAETPAVTQWSPVDLADADGDGRTDVILQGDAYEDHWLEVVSVGQGSSRTVFSGLGYYL